MWFGQLDNSIPISFFCLKSESCDQNSRALNFEECTYFAQLKKQINKFWKLKEKLDVAFLHSTYMKEIYAYSIKHT